MAASKKYHASPNITLTVRSWCMSLLSNHIGPLMPPSLRTRQKWIMISKAAARGIATQWRT